MARTKYEPSYSSTEVLEEQRKAYKPNEVWQYRNAHTHGKWVDRPAGSQPGWFHDTEYRKKPQ